MSDTDTGHFLCEARILYDQVRSRDGYPFNLPAFKNLHGLKFHPKVTYVIGENGMGKSTLLEAIAIALGFNPEGGTKDMLFSTKDTHSPLHQYLRLSRGVKKPQDGFFLRAESVYNLATSVEKYGSSRFGERSLHAQSHGESFFSIFLNRFVGNGIYILDEPEAALSPLRQMALLTRIHQLVAMDSQFVIATHSPIVMAYPDAVIYEITPNKGFKKVDYENTEHYRLTREFIDNPQRMVRMLLDEGS